MLKGEVNNERMNEAISVIKGSSLRRVAIKPWMRLRDYHWRT